MEELLKLVNHYRSEISLWREWMDITGDSVPYVKSRTDGEKCMKIIGYCDSLLFMESETLEKIVEKKALEKFKLKTA